jgi:histidinol-phosphate aminotransferase
MTDSLIDLSTNENPLGPSPRVVEAIERAAKTIHRYPPHDDRMLREALAAHHGQDLTPDHFFAGASGSDVLTLIARTCLAPGDEAIICSPTFVVYAMTAEFQQARLIDVLLDPATCAHDVDRILASVTPRTRLIYVCNPGNPTGVVMPATDFDRLVERVPAGVLLVADEVYYQYVESDAFPETTRWIHAGRDVVIVHSFSKGYGMAGIRLGYGIARPDLARKLGRHRLIYHLSSLALHAGAAALGDAEHVARTVTSTREGKAFLYRHLERMAVKHWRSETNFILVMPNDRDRALAALVKHGVLVRPVDGPGRAPCLRISVGLPAANEKVIDAFADLLSPR